MSFFKSNVALGLAIALFVLAGIIVAFGALAKLEHWQIASSMLSLGIITQSISFVFFGLIAYARWKN